MYKEVVHYLTINVLIHFQAGWTSLNSSLRGNLRKLSKSLVFVSARNPELKLSFDAVMSEAQHATVGMSF